MCLIVWIFFLLFSKESAEAKHHVRVINGVEVNIEQYPYVVQLLKNRQINVHCGGAIVSRRVVVTAGHCVYDSTSRTMAKGSDFNVYVGSSVTGKGTHFKGCKAIKHEKFAEAAMYYYYDIGLILLSKPLTLSKRVQIAKIPSTNRWRNVNNMMTIAGFGDTDNTGEYSKKMHATRLHYVDSRICNKSQTGKGDWMPISEHMFCMVGSTTTSDCYGDSGSPISWRSYIVGLVSVGRDSSCGSESIPSMYTDLTYFRNWIMDHIRILESTPLSQC